MWRAKLLRAKLCPALLRTASCEPATAVVVERLLPAVEGGSAVKTVVNRSSTQSSLDSFLLRSGSFQKCAKPGHFFCTRKNVFVFFNIALCCPCVGVNSTVACPCNYQCELHSNGEAAAVKFAANSASSVALVLGVDFVLATCLNVLAAARRCAI